MRVPTKTEALETAKCRWKNHNDTPQPGDVGTLATARRAASGMTCTTPRLRLSPLEMFGGREQDLDMAEGNHTHTHTHCQGILGKVDVERCMTNDV